MPDLFKIGDTVTWNYSGNIVSGKIIKIHTGDFDFKDGKHRASKENPQYEVRSDESGKTAAHKGEALAKK